MKERLTDDRIASIGPAPAGKRLEIFDTALPGLNLRVTDRGVKSFAVRYRHSGRTLRYTIGRCPPLRLKKAREIAYGLIASSRQGENPMDAKRAAKATKDRSPTCEKVVDRFIAKGLTQQKPTHAAEVGTASKKRSRRTMDGATLASIETADVAGLLEKIASPSTKRHTYFALRRLFNWAKGVGIITTSPIGEDFPTPAKPNDRERVLEADELTAIWRVVIGTYSTYHSILQLLIVTGQRRDEVAEAQWSEFDLKKKLWTIPAQRTKTGKTHHLPLSSLALQILENIPHTNTIHLFPGEAPDDKEYKEGQSKRATFSGWSRAKRRLDEKSNASGWRLHDIRRTVATRLAEQGVGPHVVERILNHSSGVVSGVAEIYNRASYQKEMREAQQIWDDYLCTLVPTWEMKTKFDMSNLKFDLPKRSPTRPGFVQASPLPPPKVDLARPKKA